MHVQYLMLCSLHDLQKMHHQPNEGDTSEERVWLIHKNGFSLARVMPDNVPGRRGSELSRQASLVRSGGRESYRVMLHKSGQILDVEEEDLEKVLCIKCVCVCVM